MKTILLRTVFFCFSIVSLVALSSCGGGGGSSNPSGASGSSGGGATGTGGATTPNSILSGKYAFSFTGTVTSSGAPIFLAGSFTADGAGNITTGVEDVNQVGLSVSKGVAISGTYSIGADGRGTLNITSGVTQTFKIAVENGNHGQIIRFDTGAAGSGSFDLQTSSAFSLNALTGKYAFEWNGFDSTANENPLSGIGEVSLSSGALTGGADINDGGNYSQLAASGTFQSPDGNGHGTASFTYGTTTLTYAYDIISANRILLIEIDTAGGTVGEADLQSATFTTASLFGNYAFVLSQPLFGLGMVGQITTDGQGNISSSDSVENNFGALASGTFPGTYTLSPTVAGVSLNGRFVLTATEPSLASDNFVVYLISPTQAFVMETDSDQLIFGQLLAQTGSPYAPSSLNGNYGLNLSGVDGNDVEADFVGQIASGGTSTLTGGTLDINDEDPTTLPSITDSNSAISGGSYSVTNTTTGHGTLSFTASTTAGALPFQFYFYFVSPSQIFMLQIDDNVFVTIGSALAQPTIP
ncbi:MAG TPA: hypothetical protein VG322_14355 [Candidatus Acidoferrales bacterium]|jgi:hypothetical protein|nr:hypothetical protein [Candidatus Acidoferrales bacterium]